MFENNSNDEIILRSDSFSDGICDDLCEVLLLIVNKLDLTVFKYTNKLSH